MGSTKILCLPDFPIYFINNCWLSVFQNPKCDLLKAWCLTILFWQIMYWLLSTLVILVIKIPYKLRIVLNVCKCLLFSYCQSEQWGACLHQVQLGSSLFPFNFTSQIYLMELFQQNVADSSWFTEILNQNDVFRLLKSKSCQTQQCRSWTITTSCLSSSLQYHVEPWLSPCNFASVKIILPGLIILVVQYYIVNVL